MKRYQIEGIHPGGAKGPFAIYAPSPEDARRTAEGAGIAVSAVVLSDTGSSPPVAHPDGASTTPLPQVAKVACACPTCGSLEYRALRPRAFVAFSWDRKCTGCGTRYRPPTPRWGAVLLILAGLVLGLVAFVGAVAVLLGWVQREPGPASLLSVLTWLGFFGFLASVGAFAVVEGLRALLADKKM